MSENDWPVINAVFPSGKNVTTTDPRTGAVIIDENADNNNNDSINDAKQQLEVEEPASVDRSSDNKSTSSPSAYSQEIVSPHTTEPSSPAVQATTSPTILSASSLPALGGSVITEKRIVFQPEPDFQPQQPVQKLEFPTPTIRRASDFPEPVPVPIEPLQQQPQVAAQEPAPTPAVQPRSLPTPIETKSAYLPELYTQTGTHPITMAAVAPPAQSHFQEEGHPADIHSAKNDTHGTNERNSVDDQDYALASQTENLNLGERPVSRATHRTTNGTFGPDRSLNEHNDGTNHAALNRDEPEQLNLESALDSDPNQLRREADGDVDGEYEERPRLPQRASRSYVKPIPIVTTYERELPDDGSVARRKSVAGSTKAPSVKRAPSKAASIKSNKAASVNGDRHDREHIARPPSVAGSTRRLPQLAENAAGGLAVGEVASHERQRQLQQGDNQRHSLQDNGPISRDRSTTFEEPSLNHNPNRATSPSSPQRPHSAFGYRPQPNLMAISESDRPESRYDGQQHQGQDSRAGVLNRNGTVLSRAGTLGRNGTLSRGANGGTIGSRRGAFGRGAGASIGTQPEEVLGRDDIHMRAELSERILDDATLRKLSTMEKKDARRLSKVIKSEGKAEAKAVSGSIKELERLTKLQREAAAAERKSQLRLSKWTRNEHKARLRFLKEKERYEKIEGELRNAENDYEERRDHAAGLTAQVAEKTQELDDLRSQKAADDRERAVKLLALKNPAHS
ncbi:DNA binding protein Ncp1 [Kwoniella heveanensis BCC8398]|uniref:DNA binding protein Ncp1 n=1 Tax=Kwoniella heveanensis BCC8398 TaxID=1296120 RepID=A0A1B9GH26_9TREE|nr:DNA binding protein Ncp1 [Kwoniella heveanensis BCC8398]